MPAHTYETKLVISARVRRIFPSYLSEDQIQEKLDSMVVQAFSFVTRNMNHLELTQEVPTSWETITESSPEMNGE